MSLVSARGSAVMLAAVFAAAVPGVPSADAEVVTFLFTGVVTSVSDSGGVLDGSVAAGTPFEGLYSFESTAPDSDPSPESAFYRHTTPPYGAEIEVGNYTFLTDPSNVLFDVIVNDYPWPFEEYGFDSANNLPQGPEIFVVDFRWQMRQTTDPGVLVGEALPLDPPDPTEWVINVLRIEGTGFARPGFVIEGTVQTLTEGGTPVEAATWGRLKGIYRR